MKKAILPLFLCVGLSGIALADMHDPPGAAQGPTRKLSRGIANLTLGTLEIPFNVTVTNSRFGNEAAVTYGVVLGVGKSIRRLGWGAWETISFLAPCYKGSYRQPYRPNIPWTNGGLTEFPPAVSWDASAGHTRQNY